MGPLSGLKIIELAGIGPGPFCGMMLADMGAEVVRVERPGESWPNELDPLLRNRRSIVCDLKHPDAIKVLISLVRKSDAIFEGFRPGVAEKLGIGPDVCLDANPRIVYGRLTGWGQSGPLANHVGHDINYIALTGALHAIGTKGGKPVPPLNLVGDYGGGGMLLAFGMVCAMLSASRTGKGQVVDAAMVDGTNAMMAFFHGLKAMGLFDDSETGSSFLSGAAHFYDTYETADGKFVSIAAVEPQFYKQLIEKLGLDPHEFGDAVLKPGSATSSGETWARLKAELVQVFRSKTRAEWVGLLQDTDVCFAPVLNLSEAIGHEHNKARGAFVQVGETMQPAPAPRFSSTAPATPVAGVAPGAHTREVLAEVGYSPDDIDGLIAGGAVSLPG